ncbi:MAG: SGNH/GDSL hydrolase family protein [Planctomycetaceae bacterium]
MTTRAIRMIRHILAAILLIASAGAGAELYLRRQMPDTPSWVCSGSSCAMQPLLIPSETHHHLLRPGAEKSITVNGNRVRYQINSLGTRGTEVTVPKPAGTFRILVLGDETVFGPRLPQESTLPGQIQKLLSGTTSAHVEVVNGGVPGYCPLLGWLAYEYRLKELDPDLIVLHFDMTDVADDARYRSLYVETVGQPPVCLHESLMNPNTIPRVDGVLQTIRNSAVVSLMLEKTRDYLRTSSAVAADLPTCSSPIAWALDNPPDVRIQVRHALSVLVHLKKALAGTDTQLLVTTCPSVWQVVPGSEHIGCASMCQLNGSTPLTSRLPFDVLAAYCEQQGIRFLDASASFLQSQTPEVLFWMDDGALGPAGTTLYARSIAAYLVQSPPRTWNQDPGRLSRAR